MLATAGAGLVLALLAPAAAAPAVVHSPHAGAGQLRAVVIAVPDLRWSDLAFMPRLRAFAGTAAVGDLSVKTAAARADCNDGLLTFNAGDRVDSDVPGCGLSLEQYKAAKKRAAGSSFGADVGSLGHILRTAGFVTDAVNIAAVPLLADGAGQVDQRPDATRLVSPTAPSVDAIVDDDIYAGRPEQRTVDAGKLDSKIDQQIAEIPPQTTIVLAGLSDAPTGHPHLHVLLIRHPGWRHVELARPASGPPYVSLIDLAPTLLDLLGRTPPADMAGRVLHPTATPARAWTAYADEDLHAQAARSASKPLRYTLAIAALAILLLLVLAGRRRGRDDVGAAAVWLARLAVGVPVFAYLVQRLPWWRDSSVAVAVMFACAAIAFAVVVTVTAGRRGVVWALLVVPAITAIALLVDQVAGAPLQISAPLGDNPIIGGRFHGMGNIDFTVFAPRADVRGCCGRCPGRAWPACAGPGRRGSDRWPRARRRRCAASRR